MELALGCGFESQATFTRAFTRDIGVPPGRFRRERLLAPVHRYPPLDLAALLARARREDMEPRIVRRPAFHVVGLAGRFTPATTSHIPVLWERFVPHMDHVPHRRGSHTLGVCVDADPSTIEQDGFTYVAGVEVERIDGVPDGLIALTVPANAYAVFTHAGHIARFPDTVKQVWGRWLPASRYRHVRAPDFEWYDERWDPAHGRGRDRHLRPRRGRVTPFPRRRGSLHSRHGRRPLGIASARPRGSIRGARRQAPGRARGGRRPGRATGGELVARDRPLLRGRARCGAQPVLLVLRRREAEHRRGSGDVRGRRAHRPPGSTRRRADRDATRRPSGPTRVSSWHRSRRSVARVRIETGAAPTWSPRRWAGCSRSAAIPTARRCTRSVSRPITRPASSPPPAFSPHSSPASVRVAGSTST